MDVFEGGGAEVVEYRTGGGRGEGGEEGCDGGFELVYDGDDGHEWEVGEPGCHLHVSCSVWRGGTHDSVGWKSLRSGEGERIEEVEKVDSRRGISTPSGNFPLAFSLNGRCSRYSIDSSSSSSSSPTENAVAGVTGVTGVVIVGVAETTGDNARSLVVRDGGVGFSSLADFRSSKSAKAFCRSKCCSASNFTWLRMMA